MQEIVVKMFTNFAKYGDPNGKDMNFQWEPVSFEFPEKHLIIRIDPVMRDKLDSTRIERLSSALDTLML